MVINLVFYTKLISIIFIFLFKINSSFGHDPNQNLQANKIFEKFNLPTFGESKPIGFYAKGCLSGGVKLKDTGPTWQVMRPSRNRNWGHPDVINYIKDLSEFLKLSETREESKNRWLVDVADINTDTWDLTVNNPNRVEEVDNRTPTEIIAEIEELDAQAAQALQAIKELL